MTKVIDGVMLNAYPDSLGNNLNDALDVLKSENMKNVFDSFYILPSVFNTDLDRGFSIIDYGLNKRYASRENIEDLKKLGIKLKFDFVLNHLSVLSPQFQDIIKNGEKSEYKDFFINWNQFWKDRGKINEDGVLEPDPEYIRDMFFRKAGLPILSVRFPDGREVPYWNTFYQELKYQKVDYQELMNEMDMQYLSAKMLSDLVNEALDEGLKPDEIDFGEFSGYRDATISVLETKRQYLGQMDLNIKSAMVWDFYDRTLNKLSEYGASIVRLDAFAYASKEAGKRNFFNLPETWDELNKVKKLADKYGVELLPEIHSRYNERLHEEICERGFLSYDFFLPGLIIDAFEHQTNEVLLKWINDIREKDLKLVNMLGCHDGIPLLDLEGLLTKERIGKLIDTVVDRGGYVKELHGRKNVYYQVNATYYSALGEDDKKMNLARAIQVFMPGKPQVWYLDLFKGTNDYEALKKAGTGGHKEINRSNLSLEDISSRLEDDCVKEQLKLLKLRNNSRAFGFDARMTVAETENHLLDITWENHGEKARLVANLNDYSYEVITG